MSSAGDFGLGPLMDLQPDCGWNRWRVDGAGGQTEHEHFLCGHEASPCGVSTCTSVGFPTALRLQGSQTPSKSTA